MSYTQAKFSDDRPARYVYTRRGSAGPPFYTRIQIAQSAGADPTPTVRKLKAATVKTAATEAQRMRHEQGEAAALRLGDPLAFDKAPKTVGWLCRDYQRSEHYGRYGSREGRRIAALLTFWEAIPVDRVNLGLCDDYHAWRTIKGHKITRGPGHRTVDIELTTLSTVFAWAIRRDFIKRNPIGGRGRYQPTRAVKHCTGAMPKNDEQVHQLASELFKDPRSVSLGWQLLYEAFTGARSSEIVKLRWDAFDRYQPGFITGAYLSITRSKHGISPWIILHPALRQLIAAHQEFKAQSPAISPWFFPGDKPDQAVASDSLTRALARICPKLDLHHITSHGLRAYHVRALRSQGIDDSEISKRLGHASGVRLVETTYGVTEPGWFGAGELDFMPSGPTAWENL